MTSYHWETAPAVLVVDKPYGSCFYALPVGNGHWIDNDGDRYASPDQLAIAYGPDTTVIPLPPPTATWLRNTYDPTKERP